VKKSSPRLQQAVFANDAAALLSRLRNGCDVNETDRDGRTALHHAVIAGSKEMVDTLLQHGASIDAADKQGWTALHFAAQQFEVEIARALLGAGATVDPEDENGNTPLWRAVFTSQGRGEMINVLLSAAADKNRQNRHGVSPASLAQTIANFPVAEFLR
jgi:uncharacterized protein